MRDVIAERRAEQQRLVELARDYVARLSARIPLTAAVVVGSVARGDFNVWSDVDVVIVAQGLPERAPDRAALLLADAPGGVSRSASRRRSSQPLSDVEPAGNRGRRGGR